MKHARVAGARRWTGALAALAAVGAAVPAVAQPLDPYQADAPPPLERGVAAALLARAELLLDGGDLRNAQQLAREALALLASGNAAEQPLVLRARAILARAGPGADMVPIDPPPTDPGAVPPGPAEPPPIAAPASVVRDGRRAALGYGAALGATLGGVLGAAAANEDSGSAGGAVAGMVVGAGAVGGLGYLVGPRLTDPQARLLGSAGVWGTVTLAAMADVVTGVDGTSASDVAWGATLGGAAGLGLGYALHRRRAYTAGDVALMDAFAGIGTLGGLTLGLALAPVEGEGYSLNVAIGAAGGWLIGMAAAPSVEASPARVLRIGAHALTGAAAPWILYPLLADSGSDDDEQAIGLLSTIGLVAGAYVGFRRTRGLHGEGVAAAATAGPSALLERSPDGGWRLGAALPRVERDRGAAPRTMLTLAAGGF
ncbi:MAG: hypothetical protein R2939_11730 [Kofleriaceae bacterium]